MKILLTILLLFPLFLFSQGTYKWTITPSEYGIPAIDSIGRIVIFSGNLGLTGNSGAGTSGVPRVISTPGTTFVFCNNTLHGSSFIDSHGNVWVTGNNTVGEMGLPGGASAGNLVELLVDSRGVAFTNITIVQGSYIQIGANDVSGQYFVKHGTLSDTVFYAGIDEYGMGGDGSTGTTTYFTPQLMFSLPTGQRIIQMCSESGTAMLLNNGQVWTWGAAGTASYLGRTITGSNYASPGQVTGFDDSIRQIVGGAECGMVALSKNDSLWGWGPNAGYLGNAGNPSYNTPHNLGDSVKRSGGMENGTTRTRITQISANSNCFHVIMNDSTLWGWGDNGMGSIGNGTGPNYASPGGTSTPWFIDPSAVLVLPQTHPVRVLKVHNFVYIPSGCLFSFSFFALDANGQLYACGRNKGGVIPNGVIECPGDGGDLSSFYPNSWDLLWLTPINPYGVASAIPQGCLGCHIGAVTANCHTCGPSGPAVANPGSNQSISTTVVTLNGLGSHTTGGSVVYFTWTQLSGPNTGVMDNPGSPIVNISGLIVGVYTFQLAVQDNGFNTNTQTVTVIVSSAVPQFTYPSGNKIIILVKNGNNNFWNSLGSEYTDLSTYWIQSSNSISLYDFPSWIWGNWNKCITTDSSWTFFVPETGCRFRSELDSYSCTESEC